MQAAWQCASKNRQECPACCQPPHTQIIPTQDIGLTTCLLPLTPAIHLCPPPPPPHSLPSLFRLASLVLAARLPLLAPAAARLPELVPGCSGGLPLGGGTCGGMRMRVAVTRLPLLLSLLGPAPSLPDPPSSTASDSSAVGGVVVRDTLWLWLWLR